MPERKRCKNNGQGSGKKIISEWPVCNYVGKARARGRRHVGIGVGIGIGVGLGKPRAALFACRRFEVVLFEWKKRLLLRVDPRLRRGGVRAGNAVVSDPRRRGRREVGLKTPRRAWTA